MKILQRTVAAHIKAGMTKKVYKRLLKTEAKARCTTPNLGHGEERRTRREREFYIRKLAEQEATKLRKLRKVAKEAAKVGA